jgi:ADP-ribosylglycohydrolase
VPSAERPHWSGVSRRSVASISYIRGVYTRREAIVGGFMGAAIGDALGFATEFRSRKKILETFGPDGITDFVAQKDPRWKPPPQIIGKDHPPGTFSDDTQMAICVAEAILAAPGRDLERVMRAMSQRFVHWAESDDNDRAPGATCMSGCRRLAEGAPWQTAGLAESKGCGSVMRVAPIAFAFAQDPAWMLELARASSLPTHRHPAAVEGCAATALAVAFALDRMPPAQLVDAIERTTRGRCSDLDAAFDRLRAQLSSPPEEALHESQLGEGWVAEEALVSALYCFLRSPDDFRATMLTAINTDGDSDSIACIAGAISGGYNGLEAIPPTWRERVEDSARLHQLGEALAASNL